jgi:pimeloyl-ACP methyl ester carboxylesterase
VIETYERWLPTLPDGRLVIAPRSGHLVPLDDEDLLVEVVRGLVADVRAKASV